MKQEAAGVLTEEKLKEALHDLPGWSGNEKGLQKTIRFENFRTAMQFMQDCVSGIESRNHHPVWCNTYNKLDIRLDTADAGHRVTQKDVELAHYFESVLGNYSWQ